MRQETEYFFSFIEAISNQESDYVTLLILEFKSRIIVIE